MSRKSIVLLVVLALGGLMVSGASSRNRSVQVFVYPLRISLVGPRYIQAGQKTTYYLVVKYSGAAALRLVQPKMWPTTPIVKSIPMYKTKKALDTHSVYAVWMMKNFAPGTSRRVKLTLRFPLPKKNNPSYTFELGVDAVGTSAVDHKTVTLLYRK